MTAHIISSGRSCKRAVSELFLGCIDDFGRGDINIEYSVHRDNAENRWWLSLTSPNALVRALT